MKLIIVESPTKAKTISKFLSSKYRVLSSYGHIRDLPKSEIGIDIEQNFKPKYVIPTRVKKTVNSLKKEVEKAESVILAVDEDREGEAIAWHLIQALQLGKFQIPNNKLQTNSKSQITNSKPYARIVFHEITKQAIEGAIDSPRDIDINLVDAQQARRVLDRLVGYNLSPFLWKKIARGLSAGRVQSIAVKLICEREKEIEKFVAQEYWTVVATLRKQTQNAKRKTQNNSSKLKTEFESFLIKKDGKIIPKMDIKNKKEAEEIVRDLEKAEYKVINIKKKEIKRNPLPPFTTPTLQQEAWKKFRWTAKNTMRVAQQLYEKGLTTYHRTDSLSLSGQSLEPAKKFIIKNYDKDYYQFRKYKTKTKTAQEAHEAIRPTYPDKTPNEVESSNKLDDNQARLYNLIWCRFIACQMAEAIFNTISVDIQAKNYTFRMTGQTLKFDGFLRVYPIKYEETELPPLKINEILEFLKLNPFQHFTQPPARYTEASLIKVLEENGIGRPSTYAPTLSAIQERNYIKKNNQKRFQPTKIGLTVNSTLTAHFPKIVDINFTAKMEENLDKIAKGSEEWAPIIRDFYDPFKKNLDKKYQEVPDREVIKKPTDKICPKCKSPLFLRSGKFGEFYACSKFPECKHTESLKKNNLGIKCSKCQKGEVVEKRTKKKKIFYGCSAWPSCDFALWDKPINEKCPKCKSLLVETKKGGKKCSNKECLK